MRRLLIFALVGLLSNQAFALNTIYKCTVKKDAKDVFEVEGFLDSQVRAYTALVDLVDLGGPDSESVPLTLANGDPVRITVFMKRNNLELDMNICTPLTMTCSTADLTLEGSALVSGNVALNESKRQVLSVSCSLRPHYEKQKSR